MINIIGAENVFADKKGWIAAEPEIVVNLNPDVILTNVNYIENPTKEILSRSGWENMKAVKDKQVYYIDNIASSIPNHNIVKALKEMAKAVYPDKYKDAYLAETPDIQTVDKSVGVEVVRADDEDLILTSKTIGKNIKH